MPAETLVAVVITLLWEGATAAIAAVFAVSANWDYLREVTKREAKPRLASWVIWTVAMTVGSVGAARMAQWPAAALGFACAATCGSVVVAGWRHGDKKLTWLDGFALLVGGAGIVLLTEAMLWPDRFPMTVAIGISVLTDLCAFVPTYDNARNGEEAPRPYIKDTIGAAAAFCPLRQRCTSSPSGRSVAIHPDEGLAELRQRQQTPAGRARLRERVQVEHTLAHIGHWQGRRARYRGTRKNLFDLRRVAVVHNLHLIACHPTAEGYELAA